MSSARAIFPYGVAVITQKKDTPMKTVFMLLIASVSLSGCFPALVGAAGSSVVLEECVENESSVCDKANDALQGRD